MYRKLCLSILLILLIPAISVAGPIYVYKEPDGVIHFTSKPPPAGKKAEVFTAKGTHFSFYRGARRYSHRLFRHEYASIINEAARLFRVESALIRAVIHAESGFNPRAVSRKGALGLMQIMPANVKLWRVGNAFIPENNIYGGVRHLSDLLKKYSGNLRFALAAYNAGAGAVEKYGGVPPYEETQNYVQTVLSLRQRYAVQ